MFKLVKQDRYEIRAHKQHASHSHTHRQTQVCMNTHTHLAYMHRCILARTHTHMYARTCKITHMHACTHAPTHIHTHTYAHARSHPIYMYIEEKAVWCFGVVYWTDYKVEKTLLLCRLAIDLLHLPTLVA